VSKVPGGGSRTVRSRGGRARNFIGVKEKTRGKKRAGGPEGRGKTVGSYEYGKKVAIKCLRKRGQGKWERGQGSLPYVCYSRGGGDRCRKGKGGGGRRKKKDGGVVGVGVFPLRVRVPGGACRNKKLKGRKNITRKRGHSSRFTPYAAGVKRKKRKREERV